MFSSSRFPIRSWMVIYAGLIATIVLAGRPVVPDTTSTGITPAPVIADSPLLRRDI